jgi:KRAB domain-containing zinc finger protein
MTCFYITGSQYHCTVCTRLFKTQGELETHTCGKTRRVSRKEKTHKCDTCGKMFARRDGLTEHIRTVHNKIARLSCPYCKYRTDNQGHLTRHISTHTGEKQFKCTQCDYTGAQKQHLLHHIYRQHTNKTYRCQYKKCGVRKSTQEELFDHIRSDHPLQRYTCDVCPMSFKDSTTLTRHKITHGERDSRFECKYCGKRFHEAHHLDRHSVTHTGERSHICSVCNKGFTVRGNLRRHMRIHTGEKPFSCSYCNASFRFSSNKALHEITCEFKYN